MYCIDIPYMHLPLSFPPILFFTFAHLGRSMTITNERLAYESELGGRGEV